MKDAQFLAALKTLALTLRKQGTINGEQCQIAINCIDLYYLVQSGANFKCGWHSVGPAKIFDAEKKFTKVLDTPADNIVSFKKETKNEN